MVKNGAVTVKGVHKWYKGCTNGKKGCTNGKRGAVTINGSVL